MVHLKLNHQVVKAKKSLTILDVAKANGINIPTLCHITRGNLQDNPRAVCRICVVEIKGVQGLVTACSTKVSEGAEIFTHSEPVVQARKVLMEFILAENYSRKERENTMVKQLSDEIGVDHARFTLPKKIPSLQLSAPEYFSIDPSLCIHCDRCIIACDSRQVITRTGFGHNVSTSFGGNEQVIDLSDCNYCGDCVSVCPAGGLTRGTP